jgi:hypothetical protein
MSTLADSINKHYQDTSILSAKIETCFAKMDKRISNFTIPQDALSASISYADACSTV